MNIQLGDILTLKKAHPCGSSQWKVLRIGADFKLRCLGCSHEVMGARSKFEKQIKSLERQGETLSLAQLKEKAEKAENGQG